MKINKTKISKEFLEVKSKYDRLGINVQQAMETFLKEKNIPFLSIQNRVKEFKVPVYLGHGVNDKMCPVSQTEIFSKKLKEVNPSLNQVLNLAEAGHNYKYWNSEVNAILAFFEENRK